MEIMTAEAYYHRQKARYSEACKNWKQSDGGFPQAAFYFFTKHNATDYQRDGFVAFDDRMAILRPTLIGVKRCWNKMLKKGY